MLIAAGYMNYTSNEKQALETAVLTDSEKYAGIGDATLVSANVADNNDLVNNDETQNIIDDSAKNEEKKDEIKSNDQNTESKENIVQNEINTSKLKRSNFDVVHLTFLVKDITTNEVAKFIITLPDELLKPDVVTNKHTDSSYDNRNNCICLHLVADCTRNVLCEY